MRVVVIGIGNPYRRDDAAGVEVAARLREAARGGVEVVEHDGEPGALLDLWQEAGVAFVVDAVRSGGEPGAVHWTEVGGGPIPAEPRRDSSHAFGLADAVELARALDRLPRRLVLVGIEGREFTAGTGLTPAVAAAVPRVVQMILDEISEGA